MKKALTYSKGSVNATLTRQAIVPGGVAVSLGLVNDLYLLRDKRENGEPLLSDSQFDVTPFNFSVSKLHTNKDFQNRGEAFSEISVQRILHAVNSGAFNWAAFDPITIWKDSRDGKYYILSGHSRSEAFRRLAKSGKKVDGIGFEKIPAKIFNGTFADAKHFAQNSNTLATKETNTERAKYYHKLIELADGKKATVSKIKEEARQNEGKEFSTIWALSFLDPRGIAFETLSDIEKASPAPETKLLKEQRADVRDEKKKNNGKKQKQETVNGLGAVENKNNAEILAVWTGKLRAAFPQLTNDHENEIYLYLAREAYPTKYKTYSDFKQVVEGLIKAHSNSDGEFNASKKLNLARASEELGNEKQYQFELQALDKEIKSSESKYSKLLQELVKRNAGKKDFNIDEALQFLKNAISAVIYDRRKKIEFEKTHGLYQQADRDQQSLFAMDGLAPEFVKTLSGLDVSNTKQPATIFNCSESELVCNGMQPTYIILPDYSQLIEKSDGQNKFVGNGFNNATLSELRRACRNWRQVEKLAKHLKGDTMKQSCFNIWHWEHTNIKYNYDAPGKEEIRTPARTWADRATGVDCDCLAVLTYCLLYAMGYKPKFEIVAFNYSDKFSHIYVNCNGLAVDRVLPVFASRPLFITKRIFMEVPVYELSGCKGLGALDGLRGLYESTLSKVKTGKATPKEKLDFKKAEIMVKLAGTDYNGYRLAGLIMPYVSGIDEKDGGYYFENPEIAKVAKAGEYSILQAEQRGASEEELNGIFKAIGKGLKKVAKATAKIVAAPVKATVNATKATVNVVKAGVQAATGNKTAAKETLKKAASQTKAAVVDPVKTTVKSTATIVKETVINPTVSTIKIAGKAFKVIFIKINPVTVLMRNSLRALVAINFLGMATRLNVANLTKEEAIKAGYTEEHWNSATKAKKRVVNFFTKMGGKKDLIEKTIVKGSKRKALFKKDYNANTQVNITDDDATLSGAGIAACLTAVGGFFVKIWNWIKKIVPKVVNAAKKASQNETVQNIASQVANAANNSSNTTTTTTTTEAANTSSQTTTDSDTSSTTKIALIIAAVAAGGYFLTRKK